METEPLPSKERQVLFWFISPLPAPGRRGRRVGERKGNGNPNLGLGDQEAEAERPSVEK